MKQGSLKAIFADVLSSKHGISKGKDELLKGKLKVEQSLGLGHQPNVIPLAEPEFNGEHRTVEIGWHPVAGLAGKWFAERTGLGKMIKEKINKYPDPTQHWAVLIGDYAHELWMASSVPIPRPRRLRETAAYISFWQDEHLHVIYINEKIDRSQWTTFEVGKTSFNDEALRQAGEPLSHTYAVCAHADALSPPGEMTIFNMREKKPAYNVISNNCQNYALLMLDAIQVGGHRDFGTTFAIYQRAIGAGKISDLFPDLPVKDDTDQSQPEPQLENAVHVAQQVMDENTTQLDCHHSVF